MLKSLKVGGLWLLLALAYAQVREPVEPFGDLHIVLINSEERLELHDAEIGYQTVFTSVQSEGIYAVIKQEVIFVPWTDVQSLELSGTQPAYWNITLRDGRILPDASSLTEEGIATGDLSIVGTGWHGGHEVRGFGPNDVDIDPETRIVFVHQTP
ncbi:hypothetical protein [Truepera radiovictrix]|nr:hypothetical protein [Truepera radiovictrix]WMT55929.1 hypothetical protein RCV51_07860 [Truepera radiovictrix]